MKNAASCETWCELQDTLSTDSLNAHCGLGSSLGFVCLRVGSHIKRDFGAQGKRAPSTRFDRVGIRGQYVECPAPRNRGCVLDGRWRRTLARRAERNPDRKRGNSLPLRGESLPTEDCAPGKKRRGPRGRISSGLGRILRDSRQRESLARGKSATSEINAGQSFCAPPRVFRKRPRDRAFAHVAISEYSLGAQVSGSDAVRPSRCRAPLRALLRELVRSRAAARGDTLYETVRGARGPREDLWIEARARERIAAAGKRQCRLPYSSERTLLGFAGAPAQRRSPPSV